MVLRDTNFEVKHVLGYREVSTAYTSGYCNVKKPPSTILLDNMVYDVV